MAENIYYNQAQKERFLASIDPNQYPQNYWHRIFMQYKTVEENKQKDLYNFTKPDIFEAHKFQNYMSYETLLVNNINLKNYTTWAQQNFLVDDGMNHYDDFTPEELFSCVNQLQLKSSIITREDLLKRIKSLQNPRDSFILLAIFEGIRGAACSDLIELKIEDVDATNNTMRLQSGQVRPVSAELVHYAQWANKITTYIRGDDVEYRLAGDKIIKTVVLGKYSGDDSIHRGVLQKIIMRILKEIGLEGKISINSLWMSGAIDALNRIAESNGVTAKEAMYTPELWDEFHELYPIPINTRKRFLMKYEDFLK